MRQMIVAGNWKMHGNRDSIAQLLSSIKQGVHKTPGVKLIVFPPYVYLAQVAESLKQSAIAWGAQNISINPQGAYTGEISAPMLCDFGCAYVIIGHSERRQLFGENSTLVAQKLAIARQFGLTPILCVGETQEQRQQQKTVPVITEQMQAVLNQEGGIKLFREAVIAYEPIWAIGTGLTATPEQAQAVHLAIRQFLAQHDKSLAQQLPILYGGSVQPTNAAKLFAMPDIDGALVGGASLQGEAFLQIAQAAVR
jgi:triosephosphate isomerase (TIM)